MSFLKELCYIIKSLKDNTKESTLPIINTCYISVIRKIEYEGFPYVAWQDTNLVLPVQETNVFLILATITLFYSPEGTPVSGKYGHTSDFCDRLLSDVKSCLCLWLQ